jgi:hypothetical protein
MPDVIRAKYGAPVTTGGTLVFGYPPGRSGNDYRQDGGAAFFVRSLQNNYVQNVDFTLAYGELQVVLTWLNAVTIPYDQAQASTTSGDRYAVGLELPLAIDAALALLPKTSGGNDYYIFT